MADLIERLKAALDEDERVAMAAESQAWHAREPDSLGLRVVSVSFDTDQVTASILSGNANHIARHDPARTLAMVAAHRKILDLHRTIEDPPPPWQSGGDTRYACSICDYTPESHLFHKEPYCDTVLALAAAYGITP